MQDDINQEITFRKLSVFMMFMAKGNIARTAEAMKLSSVSVHRALHTLEEGVGCPLFVHKGRNLLPLQAAWTLLEYCQDVMSLMSRGLEEKEAMGMIVRGFVEPISRELPMEYALELNRLVELQMEGSVG